MQTIPQIDATQPRHRDHDITITLEQADKTDATMWHAWVKHNDIARVVSVTTTSDLYFILNQAFAVADDIIAEHAAAAKAAKQAATPAKQSRKAKTPTQPTCICVDCMQDPAADIADGVYTCTKNRCYNVYFHGRYVDHFPTKTQATVALNKLRHPHLRHRAA